MRSREGQGHARRHLAVLRSAALLVALGAPGAGRAEPVARFPEASPASPTPGREEPSRSAAAGARHATVPSGAEELASRARRFESEGRFTEAMAAYSESIRLDAGDGTALLALGRLRARLGDTKEAELLFTTATRYRDVAAEALTERARLRRALGHDAEALADLEAADALGAGDASHVEELSAWYVARRAWLPALSAWRRASADVQTPEAAHRAKVATRALAVLAAELDPVAAGSARGHSFTRHQLARLSRR
jgi:cytochrome c-type biogenesis protein CcmH